MRLQRHQVLWVMLCLAPMGAPAQPPPMTLRQAIDHALGQNPQAAMAHADQAGAAAAARQARTQLLPQLTFTEDIS
ncbi:MAG TPA: hypothetical protein VF730_10760, partial [Terracidiphilus sp.]